MTISLQLQESTMPQLMDRMAAIREGATVIHRVEHFRPPALRELHAIEDEIRRRNNHTWLSGECEIYTVGGGYCGTCAGAKSIEDEREAKRCAAWV